MLECLLFAPLCAGLLMLLLGNTTVCRGLLLLTAVLHTALSVINEPSLAHRKDP